MSGCQPIFDHVIIPYHTPHLQPVHAFKPPSFSFVFGVLTLYLLSFATFSLHSISYSNTISHAFISARVHYTPGRPCFQLPTKIKCPVITIFSQYVYGNVFLCMAFILLFFFYPFSYYLAAIFFTLCFFFFCFRNFFFFIIPALVQFILSLAC